MLLLLSLFLMVLFQPKYLTMCVCVCMSDLDGARSEKGDNDGDHVDCELELEELGDAVVDVPSPHDRLDNTREVVVSEDDV